MPSLVSARSQPTAAAISDDESAGFLPVRTVGGDGAPPFWFVGCHGGAGTTTLARAIQSGADAGRYWPAPVDGGRTQVVLVARAHASGLAAAQAAARQIAEDRRLSGIRLLGLAVVADAPGRRPRPLRDLKDLVAGAVPALWDLPWAEELRLGAPVEELTLSAPFQALRADLADSGWVDTLQRANADTSRD